MDKIKKLGEAGEKVVQDTLSQLPILVNLVAFVVQGMQSVRQWEMGWPDYKCQEMPSKWARELEENGGAGKGPERKGKERGGRGAM